MRFTGFLIVILTASMITSCTFSETTSVANLVNSNPSVPELESSQRLSNFLVRDLIRNQGKNSLSKFEDRYKSVTNDTQFTELIYQIFETYGKLSECDYKKNDIETKTYPNNEKEKDGVKACDSAIFLYLM